VESFDGRGNLSDAEFADFCVFFLETILDQIQFMSRLLELPALRTRVERYFQFQALHLQRYREEIRPSVCPCRRPTGINSLSWPPLGDHKILARFVRSAILSNKSRL
jgi:hypothetical protein